MADLNDDQLRELCVALGWQGGTYHQVLQAVQAMRADSMRCESMRERYAKLCEEWASICESGRRHGCKVGALECAKLIRANP